MRRLVPILFSILIGASAVAIGMGFYLIRANQDRAHLTQEIQKANQTAKNANIESHQAILDANKKLNTANTEIAKAQNALQIMQEEHDALANAITLDTPRPSAIRRWKETVNLQLGVSIKFPATSRVFDNTHAELVIGRQIKNASQFNDGRWFSLRPWNNTEEQNLITQFTTSTAAVYLSQGHLLIGRIGSIANGGSIFVLKVRSGTSQYLIWARDPEPSTDHATLLKVLSTLNFKK